MDNIDLIIGGMNCEQCANRLQRVLDGAVGVKQTVVSFDTRSASIGYRPRTITEVEIIALVEKTGFTAEKG